MKLGKPLPDAGDGVLELVLKLLVVSGYSCHAILLCGSFEITCPVHLTTVENALSWMDQDPLGSFLGEIVLD